MLPEYRARAAQNIKKAQGQMKLILSMLDEGKYCMDVIQQCNSAIGLIRHANTMMLESHLLTCGKKLASPKKEDRERFIKEILRACDVSTRKK